MISELQCEREQVKGRIIFMSMYYDINWSKNQTETCQALAHRVSDYARRFQRGHWSLFGSGCEQKWYGTNIDKLDGERDLVADLMLSEFGESGHLVFHARNPLERGELKCKGGEKKSIHINGSDSNTKLLFRIILSVNQFSIYGAVADLCEEFTKDSGGAGKSVAHENLDSMVIPLTLTIRPMSHRETC